MGEIWVSLDMMLWKMKMLGMLDCGDKIDPVLFSILISVVAVKMLGWMMEESVSSVSVMFLRLSLDMML